MLVYVHVVCNYMCSPEVNLRSLSQSRCTLFVFLDFQFFLRFFFKIMSMGGGAHVCANAHGDQRCWILLELELTGNCELPDENAGNGT